MRSPHLSVMLPLVCFVIHGTAQSVSGASLVQLDDALLPNPDCMYWPFNTTLLCPSGMDIPGNFDVTKISKDVQQITISGPARNILRSNAPPLPADLSKLTEIVFNGFTDERNERILIKRFVDNVKGGLTLLSIANSKVGYLEEGFLQGFSHLRQLNLPNNEIASISITALEKDSSALLASVALSENRLESIDWGVFQPLSQTLSALQVDSQRPGLKSINCSSNYRFAQTGSSYMFQFNQLDYLPQCVTNSLNYAETTVVSVANNAFCPANGMCTCPEMASFLTWACGFSKVHPTHGMSLTCGSAPNQRTWTLQNLPPNTQCNNGGQSVVGASWTTVVAVVLVVFSVNFKSSEP